MQTPFIFAEDINGNMFIDCATSLHYCMGSVWG